MRTSLAILATLALTGCHLGDLLSPAPPLVLTPAPSEPRMCILTLVRRVPDLGTADTTFYRIHCP